MRSYLLLSLCVAVVSGFHSQSRLLRPPSIGFSRFDTSRHGIFDKFIESMEAGYKGEDSAYQKQKAFDEKKRAEQRKRAEERKSRGLGLRVLLDLVTCDAPQGSQVRTSSLDSKLSRLINPKRILENCRKVSS